MKETAENFVRGTPEIQSLPEIYHRINRAIDHPNASAEEIGKVVMEDPGLTARLLRLVNSSLFAFPGEIDTISRAIALVGTQQLRDLSLATCVIEMFEDIPASFVNMETYWKHCLATACCSRLLAEHCQEENIERYFVAGLLHDIGSIVLYLKGGRKLRRLLARCTKNHELLTTAERAVFGFDHTSVGKELLALWGLPKVLQEAVEAHHTPARAKMFPRVANITHISEIMVDAMEMGSNGENYVSPISEEAWLELGLSTDYLPLIYQGLEQQWLDAQSAMLGPPSDDQSDE